MKMFLNNEEEPYSRKYMKIKLQQHYQSSVVISDNNRGRWDEITVTLLRSVNEVIADFHKQKKK